jgi:hypothetical protein
VRSPLGVGLAYPAASRPAAVGCIHASGASGEGPDAPIRGIHSSGASGEGPDAPIRGIHASDASGERPDRPGGVIHSSDAYRSGHMALRPVTDALGAWVTTPQRGHRPALDHLRGRACVGCMHDSDRDGGPDLACTPRMADSGRPAADPSDARHGPDSTLTPAAAPSRAPALARPRPLRHSPGAYLQRNGAPRSGSPGWAPLPRGRHGKKYMPADAVGKACTAK